MYDELVKRLREDAPTALANCDFDFVEGWIKEAADAIEELSCAVLQARDDISGFVELWENRHWIPVTERLPEESKGLNWHEDVMICFTSVWCCDVNTGRIEVRNRLQGKMTGNKYLDLYAKDTDWHWSKSGWEPTHWMPIVPLPEPPKEE